MDGNEGAMPEDRVIETTAGDVAAELARRGVGAEERVTVTIAAAEADVLDDARRARARAAAANIIARRKGVTLGGLRIRDLINEGRP